MDQGAIEAMKRAYRRHLLRSLLFVRNEEEFTATYKSIDVLQACRWIGDAWASVPQLALRRVWNKLLGNEHSVQPHLDDDVGIELLRR